MMNLRTKIEKIISSEKEGGFLLRGLLLVCSFLYGIAVSIRNILFDMKILKREKVPCRVISVGNITAGGTGKTPMVIFLAGMLADLGCKIAVVSRGYGGKSEIEGGIVSDGENILMPAEYSGDEPFMIAARLNKIPVLVGRKRYSSGMLAVNKFNPDIIILDDGFQHRALFRDIDLLLLDSKRPFGNGRLLPAGVLRERIHAITRADAFIFTRSSTENIAGDTIRAVSNIQPVFEAYNSFYYFKVKKGGVSNPGADFRNELSEDFSSFAGKKIVAFSGIAGNDNFRKTLSGYGCDLADFSGFPDHHKYTAGDIERISKSVRDRKAELVMTTEKDFARMNGKFDFPVDIIVVGVKMCLKNEKAFREFILSKL